MITRELIFFIFIVFLIAISVALVLVYREKFKPLDQEIPNGICAFDIDGTITHGINRASRAISRCKELGFKIAINTARPSKWYDDLDLHNLGLTFEDINNDFYHGEPFKCSFIDLACFEDAIANTKVKHLHTLSSKWNIEPKRIILLDDQWSNIAKAKDAGFSVIHANHHLGGLPDNTPQQIEEIAKRTL